MTNKPASSPLTCAVYRRISDADDRSGVERQTDETVALAASRGWRVDPALEFEDNDLSASQKAKKARPEFERLLKAIEAGKIQRLVVTEWERIERNRKDGYRFMEVAVPKGLMVATVRGADMDLATPAGQLFADMWSSQARFEVANKDARAASARAQRLARGQRTGGARCFGYTRSMEIVEVEADAVRECYRRVIEGHSLGSITRWLNGAGLITPRGSNWEPGNLGAALRKGTYVGLLESKGVQYGDGAWEAIVDRLTWERAQSILRNPARRLNVLGTNRALLTGVGTCGLCGASIHAGGSGGPKSSPIYRCTRTAHMGRQRKPVDDYVIEQCCELLRFWEAKDAGEVSFKLLDGTVVQIPGLPVEKAAAPAQLIAERRDLDRALDELAEELTLSARVLAKRTAAIEKRISELDEEIAAAMVDRPVASTLEEVLPKGDFESYEDAFLAADFAGKRDVIRFLYPTVIVHPTGRGARGFNPATVELIGPDYDPEAD